uniref:Fibroblast growth factor n=1 Tax=Lynx canadensis TaxID=61383 RepID=A0A667G3H3_LYNCA
MAEGEITTFTALTEKFNLPPGNYKKPKLLYCSNGGHFLRILPDGTVDGTRDRSDQHIQLQLSAESVGEVYIKSTETGQYLAMDTDGLLYGSVSMRLTCFQTRPGLEVSRNLVTLSDAKCKAAISLCLLFFPARFPPSTLLYFRLRHERASCDILSKYSNELSRRHRGDID